MVVLALALAVNSSAQGAPGDLDPVFGSGGLVTADFGGRSDFGLAVAIQSDGKIVTAGNSSTSSPFSLAFAVSRHNTDGTPDPAFGAGGTVLTSFGPVNAAAADVVVQPDGKIVAVGFAGGDFGVARYNADGTLDAGFGAGGLVTTDFGGFDQANGVAVQPDDKIVVVGPLQGTVGMARYNPDGSLDSTFGTGGKVVTDATPSGDGAFDVAVASGGKIVVGGGTGFGPFGTSDFLLLRYNIDGSLDSTFGSAGIVTTDFGGGEVAFAIGVGPDGKITAAGGTNTADPGNFAVARYDPNGSPDTSFGSGGQVTTDVGYGSTDTGFGVVVLPDGRAVVAGSTSSTPSTSSFGVVRYTAAGAVDTTFGNGGRTTASFGNPINNAFDIAAQADGKLVVAGGTADFSRRVSDFALARFVGDPSAIEVVVDVKPESGDNVIPLPNGVIPVAILTTDAFDAASVDPAIVCFVHDCTEKHGTGHLEDVNRDGRPDLLLHYETEETEIALGDTQACLSGKTYGGLAIHGCDRIATR